MKTTKEMIEVMQAFEDGKTIECRDGSGGYWLKISDPCWDWFASDYRIKQEWYDNIPEGGVLCWVWDSEDDKKTVMDVVRYDPESKYHFETNRGMCWKYTKPLTQQEIQIFLNKSKNIGV